MDSYCLDVSSFAWSKKTIKSLIKLNGQEKNNGFMLKNLELKKSHQKF